MSKYIYSGLNGEQPITTSLPVQVARELGKRIVAGTLAPDTMIDDENALAERYQVSRVVIRDAVKILVGKGFLEVRRGRGTRVKPRDQWVMWDDDVLAWHLTVMPDPHLMASLFDIRVAIEPMAARWAAERATAQDVEVIREAWEAMENEKGTVEKFVIADERFHRAVLRAAHNEFLTAMESVIFSALLMSVRITNQDPRDNEIAVPIHKDVYQAIANRDATAAEEATHTLLKNVAERLKRADVSASAYAC